MAQNTKNYDLSIDDRLNYLLIFRRKLGRIGRTDWADRADLYGFIYMILSILFKIRLTRPTASCGQIH